MEKSQVTSHPSTQEARQKSLGIDKSQVFKKRKMAVIFLCTLVSVLWFLCAVSYAQEAVLSRELIEHAPMHDGTLILYEGEVIGDIMERGEFAWLNVYDGENAIGVWAERAALPDISSTGSYSFEGDRIRVMGVFNRSCARHGGDLDIHAQHIEKVKAGRRIIQEVGPLKAKTAITLGVCALILFVVFVLRR